MKKTFLVVLMVVIIATPCFAQEIEPDGLFTIGDTKWLAINPFYPINLSYFGFHNGQVYLTDENDDGCAGMCCGSCFYTDLMFAIFFNTNPCGAIISGIISPLGFGIVSGLAGGSGHGTGYFRFFFPPIVKVDNNWTPPPECININ